jgi:hypothetical protein
LLQPDSAGQTAAGFFHYARDDYDVYGSFLGHFKTTSTMPPITKGMLNI